MFEKIRNDLRATYNSLHATIYALLTRGQTLESLQAQSSELADFALRMKESADEALRQAELLGRAKRRRRLFVALVLLCAASCSAYFFI
jgi:hypothetical protein